MKRILLVVATDDGTDDTVHSGGQVYRYYRGHTQVVRRPLTVS